MTHGLPDPHACPHCGFAGIAERWGETICGMCGAPRVHATPGRPVRNVLCTEQFADPEARRRRMAPSIADETARERRVHGGGPREVC